MPLSKKDAIIVQKLHQKRVSQKHQKCMKERSALPIKMLFSSFGFNAPIMKDKFVQVIPSGEALADKTCVIIPYAGYNLEMTAKREKQGLIEFGFKIDNIHVVNEPGIMGYEFPDYIYVPGGDPFKLLCVAKKNRLLGDIADCVINKRTVYIGVSAGAYLATPNIEYVTLLEDNNLLKDDFDSLGLVPRNILCHYNHYSYSVLKACEEFGKRQVMTLRDDELLVFESREWHYIEDN